MRKLFNEFFYIPKHGKIRDKVMLTRVVMTITIMVMCLAAMSITAYAYFSYNVTSGSNIIKAANFEANVSITITDSRSNPITVTKDGKIQTANLDAGSYTVLLTKGASTAKTGFCIITIGDADYYTQQIGVDVGRNLTDGSASVEFKLKVSSATKIEILSHWGTSKYYGYKDEGRPEIFIDSGYFLDLTNGDGDNSDGQDGSGTTTDTTTPPTTDTTTGSEPSNTTPSTTEPTGTSEPSESTTEPTTSTSTEPTVTKPAATEPTATEPAATEPAATESTDTTESTETQPTTENTGAIDTPTTD